ncbi:MAG: YbaK/EbsC family protein [Candidatus Cloacimonetes bacterium]|nr:YbaK/EbsC family protein [Candidatus Cloacimonadota bacterium]
MPIKKLKDFLNSHKVKYVTIKHSTAYTTQEIAASAHIPGKEMAKTVIIKVDGKMAMAVLPASNKINFALLKKTIGAKDIQLASEQEFEYTFPQCDVGAMPPFGNLYDMEVYVAESLSKEEEIAFNAGSHSELMKVAYKDFERLVNPKIVKFSSQ